MQRLRAVPAGQGSAARCDEVCTCESSRRSVSSYSAWLSGAFGVSAGPTRPRRRPDQILRHQDERDQSVVISAQAAEQIQVSALWRRISLTTEPRW